MAGRNDAAIANAMTTVAQTLAQANAVIQGQQGGPNERRLDRFLRSNPPSFKGMYDPDGALNWLQGIEKIFRVMECIDEQKVRNEFLGKYFPADVRNKKEIEFLELKQGTMSVAAYAAKFEELSRFCPHYNAVEAEHSKCLKFENGLRPEIKQFIGYQQIQWFSELVNKCRIYEEDSKARAILIYIDDVLLFSKDEKTHKQLLGRFLQTTQ
ncbi:uncharacterized protein LOC127104872 [Lathyrus oleraceus]|uniref:uncharacterized protein LOC127104872 n=1 Tax=Pisum sativum TaxID=3888 RepID=UPI0021D2FF34|nr:uncharacterized protein LOC127104872 [Pisum sativum]